MELVREFRQLSQVILLDYGADCTKLQRRREQGMQIQRASAASQMIHTAAPTNARGSDLFTLLTVEELSASINQASGGVGGPVPRTSQPGEKTR